MKTNNERPEGLFYSRSTFRAWSIPEFLMRMTTSNQRKPTILLLYMALAIIAWNLMPVIPSIDGWEENSVLTFLWGARKMYAAFVLFFLLPILIVKFVFREKLADYGLQRGSVILSIIACVIMLPILIPLGYFSSCDSGYGSVYPMNAAVNWSIHGSWGWFILHAVMYMFIYYLPYEFFFRGFLQLGLVESCGGINALLIQSSASAFLHFGHPGAEVIGAYAASLLWGFYALHLRSILAPWIQHSAIGIALDLGILSR